MTAQQIEPPELRNEAETSVSLNHLETQPDLEMVSTAEETTPIASDEVLITSPSRSEDEEPTTVAPAEEPLESIQEHSSMLSIQVEENGLKTKEQMELHVSEEPIVQEVPEVVLPAVQETIMEEIPQAVAPTTVEHEEFVPFNEPQMLAEGPHEIDSAAPHPKTRWKSWKEKIQGFIKKLFG